jgi:hypothetical protein
LGWNKGADKTHRQDPAVEQGGPELGEVLCYAATRRFPGL